jgi:hypothetical protein
MTPKEKTKDVAIDLVNKYKNYVESGIINLYFDLELKNAKECAKIAIDEILVVLKFNNLDFKMKKSIEYWLEVKQEIEKL